MKLKIPMGLFYKKMCLIFFAEYNTIDKFII